VGRFRRGHGRILEITGPTTERLYAAAREGGIDVVNGRFVELDGALPLVEFGLAFASNRCGIARSTRLDDSRT
jgi:hypothetical protein